VSAPTKSIDYANRHLRFGWWSLFVFLCLGLTLELFHGFKVASYLDVSNATRRLMWTLAHAHGALLGLIHIATAVVFRVWPDFAVPHRANISVYLLSASITLPGGFFLGGFSFYSGDPGIGIVLAPIGGLCLLLAVFRLASGQLASTNRQQQQ
jgi:hypothetical protein